MKIYDLYQYLIGNLSNPSINRWGMNLFWYNLWYIDKNSSFNIHMSAVITKLVYGYVFFGLHFTKNYFLNLFWYSDFKNKIIEYNQEYETKYFRLLEYRNKIFHDTSLVKLRKKVKNVYVSRFWFLQYQKWVIVNLYMFKPYTLKKKKKYRTKIKTIFADRVITAERINDKHVWLFKTKLLCHYHFSIFLNNKSYYSF